MTNLIKNYMTKLLKNKDLEWSFKKFKKTAEFLNLSRQYLPEMQVRELIEKTGIKTFPRPKGIPENFKVKLSKDGAGMKYVHPENAHISIRVMPGKPHSPNPCQRKPYVVQMQEGKALDKFGNKILEDTPEAHIPLEEFIYRSN